MTDLDAQIREALARMRDDDPEGNASHDLWDTDGVPSWQAALIRLARPMMLWVLGIGLMGVGTAIVGVVEAIWPTRGVDMAKAMATLLLAYPQPLYWLVAFIFGGTTLASIIKAWKG